MIPPVIVDFAARNVAETLQAIRSVADAVAAAEGRASRRTSGTGGGTRARAADSEKEGRDKARVAERNEKRLLAIRERSASMAGRFAVQQGNAEAAAAERAGTARIKIAERVAATEQRLRAELVTAKSKGLDTKGVQSRLSAVESVKGGAPDAQRAALANLRGVERVAKAEERAAQQSTRVAQQAAKAKIRAFQLADKEAEKGRRQGIRDFERSEREKAREAKRWVRQRERETTRDREQSGRRYAAGITGGAREATSMLVHGGTALAQTALQLGGGLSIQDALQDKISLERQAALLSNTTNQGEGTRVSKDAILKTVRDTSIATNTDESEVMKGINAYTAKTGHYAEGASNAAFYSKVAKTNGASVEDVMKTAGTLAVQNEGLSGDDLKNLTLQTIMQARKGSVEFSDMARAGGKITRTAVSYAGNQGQRQGELLGLSQIAMRTAGVDVAEAGTNLANISADATNHKGKVQALLGRKFLNEQGQITQGPGEFIADLMHKAGGDLTKLHDAGFNTRSQKMFAAESGVFNAAKEKAAKAGATTTVANKAGRDAVLADIKSVSTGKYDEKDLEKDFAEVMKTSAEGFEQSVRLLKQEIGDRLVPALVPLIDVLRDATPTVGKLLTNLVEMADWAAHNPIQASILGLGGMITKEVLAQIASAKLAEILKGGVGQATGPLGALGAAAGIAGVALVAFAAGKEAIDNDFKNEKDTADARRNRQFEARDLATAATRGPLTDEQKRRAVELTKQLKKDEQGELDDLDPEKKTGVRKAIGAVGALVGGKDFEEAQQIEYRVQQQTLKDTKEANDRLVKALDAVTKATEAATKGKPGADGESLVPNGPVASDPKLHTPMVKR